MAARNKSAPSAKVRVETDTFGPIDVPADRYWGAQTQRSRQNFRIGVERMPEPIVRALAIVKLAAADTNQKLGLLDKRRANAIGRAAREVIDGKLDGNFPLAVWQTGSGTQSNMNANEVIAGIANEKLAGTRGGKSPVHPNDHVNMGQSSNDSFPTALHVAVAVETTARHLLPALGRADRRARRQGRRVGRYRQDRPHPFAGRDPADARPGILGLCRAGRERAVARIEGNAEVADICKLAQGGTAVGTGLNALRASAPGSWSSCRAITGLDVPVRGPDHSSRRSARATGSSRRPGRSECAAVSLFKIANDIRLARLGPAHGPRPS
jgi:fumarate hydratase class II